MDYTLVTIFDDGTISTENFTAMTALTNQIHSTMRSQEQNDLPARSVIFRVHFNAKGGR